MYKNLVMYRNELKNKIIPNYKMLGIVTEIILSKELFKKNIDLEEFLSGIFNVTYKEYVMKSRTMILARTNRLINNCSSDEMEEYRKQLNSFVVKSIDVLSKNESYESKNIFNGWLN